mgnify:CR=1 FL=1
MKHKHLITYQKIGAITFVECVCGWKKALQCYFDRVRKTIEQHYRKYGMYEKIEQNDNLWNWKINEKD